MPTNKAPLPIAQTWAETLAQTLGEPWFCIATDQPVWKGCACDGRLAIRLALIGMPDNPGLSVQGTYPLAPGQPDMTEWLEQHDAPEMCVPLLGLTPVRLSEVIRTDFLPRYEAVHALAAEIHAVFRVKYEAQEEMLRHLRVAMHPWWVAGQGHSSPTLQFSAPIVRGGNPVTGRIVLDPDSRTVCIAIEHAPLESAAAALHALVHFEAGHDQRPVRVPV